VKLMARWRQRAAVAGIEIGHDAVRLLQFSRTGAGLQVSHYACAPLPSACCATPDIRCPTRPNC